MGRRIHIMLAEQGWIVCGIIGFLIVSGLSINTVAAEIRMQTYTYKRVGDLEIKANVYREDDETVRSVVVWIHGTEDTDVPCEQSIMVADEFKKYGIDHKLIMIAGGEHGLDGGDPKRIDSAYESAFQFVHERMTGT